MSIHGQLTIQEGIPLSYMKQITIVGVDARIPVAYMHEAKVTLE